jgi:hypothetical protein
MRNDATLLTFKELIIRASPEALDSLGTVLEGTLPNPPWERDREGEQRMTKPGMGSWRAAFVFNRSADEAAPAGSLSLILEGSEAHLANIVPLKNGQLTMAEYNAILDSFVSSGIAPLANKLGLAFDTTRADRPITHWVSEAAAKKLKAFSDTANRSTGAGHPSDYSRWLDFIVQAHKDSATLDAETLRRWLQEVERWPDYAASDLASQYDLGRDVLKKYQASQG